MEATELKERFLNLYNHIINSDDHDKMHVLGNVTKDMMMHIIQAEPSMAENYICKLESVKWHNYLTDDEADEIVRKMQPRSGWTRSQFLTAAEKLGFATEKAPDYNDNALWVAASMMSSDHGSTLADLMGLSFEQATSNEKYIKTILKLALDVLMDKDGVFKIRDYFNV